MGNKTNTKTTLITLIDFILLLTSTYIIFYAWQDPDKFFFTWRVSIFISLFYLRFLIRDFKRKWFYPITLTCCYFCLNLLRKEAHLFGEPGKFDKCDAYVGIILLATMVGSYWEEIKTFIKRKLN